MTHDDNTCGSYGKIAGRIGLTDGGSELNSMPSNCIHPLVGNAQLLWVKHTQAARISKMIAPST